MYHTHIRCILQFIFASLLLRTKIFIYFQYLTPASARHRKHDSFTAQCRETKIRTFTARRSQRSFDVEGVTHRFRIETQWRRYRKNQASWVCRKVPAQAKIAPTRTCARTSNPSTMIGTRSADYHQGHAVISTAIKGRTDDHNDQMLSCRTRSKPASTDFARTLASLRTFVPSDLFR